MPTPYHQFVRVDFSHFKAFDRFSIQLRHFNILVGPNNSGKSTILAAFRILAAALRKATSRRSETVRGPHGHTSGYTIDLRSISVAEENIFYNYDDSETATVTFTLSNGNALVLHFPEQGCCYLIPDAQGRAIITPTNFKAQFNCPIGFVPILGPVEHNEKLFQEDTARVALFNYTASRNFRNIWYHYPERFDEFRAALIQTWPGMDIERPRVDPPERPGDKPLLHMFCPEERIPREIFWAGFGFQVWCQMLTHLIQSRDRALFLIDEPDIYLHSDLQRQLLGLLRNLGPDILIATHSTEIIAEAETDDIILINKRRRTAHRIRDPSELRDVFAALGSNLNPLLTQVAKTRRTLFVEGEDFQILARFARKLGLINIANRSDFAVVPVKGFNPERIRSLKTGMEFTVGGRILGASVMDKDYRCDGERASITAQCQTFCDYVAIHSCKEIENFLLVPAAMDRAAARKVTDQGRRTGIEKTYSGDAATLLESFADERRNYVTSRYQTSRAQFERTNSPKLDLATVNEAALNEFESCWNDRTSKLQVISGKDALSMFNRYLQEEYGVSVTAASIIEAMRGDEIPDEMRRLLQDIAEFARGNIDPSEGGQVQP
ncbi:MAG TPA: ATP-binding protein [Candidatus Acidoferrum sp.]